MVKAGTWIRLEIHRGVDAYEVGSHYGNYPGVWCSLSWGSQHHTGLVFLDSHYQQRLEDLIPELKKDPRVVGYEWGSKFWKNKVDIGSTVDYI